MNDWLSQFGSYLLNKKKVARNTYQAYLHDLKQFNQFLNEKGVALEKINQNDIKEFLMYLKKDKGNVASSMARKVFTMKHFFVWVQKHYGLENPMVDITISHYEKKLPEYLTEHEIKQLCTVASQDNSLLGKRNALLISLLYTTGLRISQLIQLTISCIDIHHNCITINNKGIMQKIPLNNEIHFLVTDYIKNIHMQLTHNRPCTYLFPVIYNNNMKALSRQSAWLIIHELAHKAALPKKVSPQQLRHSFAAHRLKQGTDLQELKKLLGHETTINPSAYTRIDHNIMRTLYDKKHPRS